jgi:hypothetical protein
MNVKLITHFHSRLFVGVGLPSPQQQLNYIAPHETSNCPLRVLDLKNGKI